MKEAPCLFELAYLLGSTSNVLMNNFPTTVNGATTSGDYLSVFTTSYKDSPYIINVVLTATISDKVSIM